MLRSLLILILAMGLATEARAAGCADSDAPRPAGGQVNAVWWKEYTKWCTDCGGTVPPYDYVVGAQASCKLPPPPSGTTAAGHQMDGHIAKAIDAGVSGQISGGDAAGLVGLGILGNILLTPRTKNPAQDAERQRALEAQEAHAAEVSRRQNEARHSALLGSLKSLDEEARRPDPLFDGSAGSGTKLALLRLDDEVFVAPVQSAQWVAGGECSALLAENTESLRWADQQAREQAWGNFRGASGITDAVDGAKQGALEAGVKTVGAEELKKTFDEANARLEQAREFQAFMRRVEACVNREPGAKTGCLVDLAAEKGTDPAKEWLKGQLGKGLQDAAERAEKAAKIYQQYVQRLEETYQKQALSASRCQ